MCDLVIENQQLYEERGGFGAVWSITTDSAANRRRSATVSITDRSHESRNH